MKLNLSKLKLPQDKVWDEAAILKEYILANEKYKYFLQNDEANKTLFLYCYKSYTSYKKNKLGEDFDSCIPQGDYEYIYKMIFFFQDEDRNPQHTLRNFDKFATQYVNDDNALWLFLGRSVYCSPSQDYASFKYDVAAARTKIQTFGLKFLKNFTMLGRIIPEGHALPESLAEFEDMIFKSKIPGAEENLPLAKLCYRSGAEQPNAFKTMTYLMKNGTIPTTEDHFHLLPKQQDNLPDIHALYVNDETGSKYHLMKLPSHDPRAMMLGQITGNCQTLGGDDADVFMIDGITRPNNGFYVIIKESKKGLDPSNIDWERLEDNGHEIVGQSYAWIGKDGKSITWEAPQLIRDRAPNIEIVKLLNEFGKAVEVRDFDRVTIGSHSQGLNGAKGFTPYGHTTSPTFKTTNYHNMIKEGCYYRYSGSQQSETFVSERLQTIRADFPESERESIISVEQGEVLKKFLNGKEMSPTMRKVIVASYLTNTWTAENLTEIFEKLSTFEFVRKNDFAQLSNDHLVLNKLYFYGFTVENLLEAAEHSLKPISILIDLIGCGEQYFLSYGIPRTEIARAIKTSKSELDIKKAYAKLTAQYISKEEGDLTYIDLMHGDRLDFVLQNSEGREWLHKNYLNIKFIAELEESKFSLIQKAGSLIQIKYIMEGLPFSGFIQTNSALEIAQQALFYVTSKLLNLDITFDEISKIPFDNLVIMLEHNLFVGSNPEETIRKTATISNLDLKLEILHKMMAESPFFRDIDGAEIPQAYLDIMISENMNMFYINGTKHMNGREANIEYLRFIKNIVQLPLEKCKLLLSQNAAYKYNNVNAEELSKLDSGLIETFLKGQKYWSLSQFLAEKEAIAAEDVVNHVDDFAQNAGENHWIEGIVISGADTHDAM